MLRKHKETKETIETPPEVEALPPRRRRFVENYANPASPTFGNATQSIAAVNPDLTEGSARVLGSRELARVDTQAGVKAVLDACGASQGNLASLMWKYAQDSDFRVRSSSVRAAEKLMQAHGMLESESATAQVAVILPQLDSASLRAALRATDGEGNEVAGG